MTDISAEDVEAVEKATTRRIMENEMKIKHTAVRQVRNFFYGPTLQPPIRDQAKHFVSFGVLAKMEVLNELWERICANSRH